MLRILSPLPLYCLRLTELLVIIISNSFGCSSHSVVDKFSEFDLFSLFVHPSENNK